MKSRSPPTKFINKFVFSFSSIIMGKISRKKLGIMQLALEKPKHKRIIFTLRGVTR